MTEHPITNEQPRRSRRRKATVEEEIANDGYVQTGKSSDCSEQPDRIGSQTPALPYSTPTQES